MTPAEIGTESSSPSISDLLGDPSTSLWMRNALVSALRRDLVDAVNDAELLAHVLGEKCRRLLGDNTDIGPRLILEAACAQCGPLNPANIDPLSIPRLALQHSAETGHVVILNGTADVPDHEFAPSPANLSTAVKEVSRAPDSSAQILRFET